MAELFGKTFKIRPFVAHVPTGFLKFLSVLLQPFHPAIARAMTLSIATVASDETMDDKSTIDQFGIEPPLSKSLFKQ